MTSRENELFTEGLYGFDSSHEWFFFLYFVVEFQQFTTCFAVDLMFYVSGDDMRPLQNTQLDLKADFVNLLENVLGLANHNDN